MYRKNSMESWDCNKKGFGVFKMSNLKLWKSIFAIATILVVMVGIVTTAVYAQGKGQGQKRTPPGWEKGEKEGWFSNVPPGLSEKGEGWIPPGWSKGEKEGWKNAFPPGWEKRSKAEQERWRKNLQEAKDSIKRKGKKSGFSEKEIEQAITSLELSSRVGVPIENARDITSSAIDKGLRGEAIEKLTRAVSYGVGKEIKFDQLGKFVDEKLQEGYKGDNLALEVYKEVQRRYGEKNKDKAKPER